MTPLHCVHGAREYDIIDRVSVSRVKRVGRVVVFLSSSYFVSRMLSFVLVCEWRVPRIAQ